MIEPLRYGIAHDVHYTKRAVTIGISLAYIIIIISATEYTNNNNNITIIINFNSIIMS